ncbi:hypothetical protein P7C71_g5476, partial [Lecanoromycetidae sp. Uapishka_2]
MILNNDSPEQAAYESALEIHLTHGERWGYETHVLRQNIIGTPETNGMDAKGEWKGGVFKKPLYLSSLVINELAKPEDERAEWILTVVLPQKPGATIHYSFAQGNRKDDRPVLVVFLNGLATDQSSWLPVMAGIMHQRKTTEAGFPSLLAYDRFGQGLTTDRDPLDAEIGKEPGHGHNVADAAVDLRNVIVEVWGKEFPEPGVILVANSIGGAIARLYAQQHDTAAILFLDSVIANSDFNLWPNPDAPGFDQKAELPNDVSIEMLREQRARLAKIFGLSVVNREGLSRKDLPRLLPLAEGPVLGEEGKRPWITVVGHDFETFADESQKMMGASRSLSMRYSNPIWHQYNLGLTKLTDENFSRGPIQAKGCGHFIQKDDPDFVIEETLDLVDKVRLKWSFI